MIHRQQIKTWGKRAVKLAMLMAISGVGLIALCWVLFPINTKALKEYSDTLYLQDRNGGALRTLLGADELKCDPVPSARISHWAGKALIAAEDKRFYDHPGIDVLAIFRASCQNLSSGWIVSGASTLSTQIIRMTTPRKRCLNTKFTEAFRALQMEQELSKADILNQYLNRAPFGSNLAGIESASRFYFNKSSAHLSLGEASLLMGLPQSPSRFRPDRHLSRALKRRDYVLERMHTLGMINETAHTAAKQQPLSIGSNSDGFSAPHFCDLLAATRPLSGGTCRTTLDPELQQMAAEELKRQSRRLLPHGVRGGAVVILDVRTGAIRALVGSPDYNNPNGGQVNGATARRSPGSALKPFAYAQAFDRGFYTPETVLGDVPMQFKDYAPRNASREYHGLVTVRNALIESLNIPAIQTVQKIGLEPFAQHLRMLGLRGLDNPASHYGVSLVLGTAEFCLLDLVNAYGCLARAGEWKPYRLLESTRPAPPARIFSPSAAWFISDILGGQERSLSFNGHLADVNQPRVAWKTGTSNGHRDAWTIGYNPEYVVGVWLGNPDGHGVNALVGAESAAPIVARLFRRLYPNNYGPWFTRPAGLRSAQLCSVSGKPVGPHCPNPEQALTIPGVTALTHCDVHRLLPHDRHSGSLIPMSKISGADPVWKVTERWPRHITAFLRKQDVHDTASATSPAPVIISPTDGSTLQLLPILNGNKYASLVLKARYGNPSDSLYWFANNTFIGSAKAQDTLYWNALPGTHTLRCTTASGGIGLSQVVVVASVRH